MVNNGLQPCGANAGDALKLLYIANGPQGHNGGGTFRTYAGKLCNPWRLFTVTELGLVP